MTRTTACSVASCATGAGQRAQPAVACPRPHAGFFSSRTTGLGSRRPTREAAHTLRTSRAATVAGAAAGPAQQAPALQLQGPVAAFLDAFNRRSIDGMLRCLSLDVVYHNLNYPEAFKGKQEVERVLASLLAGAPTEWQLAVDDATGDGGAVAVVFHLCDASGSIVPLSHGVAFYRLNEAGQICAITEASEQVFKVPQAALPAVGAAAPLLQALSSLPLPGLPPRAQMPFAPQPAPAFSSAAPQPPAPAFSSAAPQRPGASSRPSSPAGQQAAVLASRSSPAGSPPAASIVASSSSGSVGGSGGGIDGLAGVWIKDLGASDMASYGKACDLMQLSGLQKTTAMQLIEGVEIEQQGEEVAVRFLTVVPFFKVTEAYRLDGVVSMSRRDLRAGSQQAAAEIAPSGGLQVLINWGEPNAGGVNEQYRLVDSSTLECMSTVQVAAGSVTTRTIYRRADGWRPRFRWNPLWGGS